MCTTGEADPLQLLRAGLSGLVDTDPVGMSDAAVTAELPALLDAVNQLGAVVAARLASFDTRALAEVDGQRTTRSWLSAFGRMSQGAAAGWLSRAPAATPTARAGRRRRHRAGIGRTSDQGGRVGQAGRRRRGQGLR